MEGAGGAPLRRPRLCRRQGAGPSLGGAVDVAATKPDERVAIEVETGKSDPLGNIEKALNAGFDKVVSLATNSSTAEATELALRAASEPINSSYTGKDAAEHRCSQPINSSLSGTNPADDAPSVPVNSSYARVGDPQSAAAGPVNLSYAPAKRASEAPQEAIHSSYATLDRVQVQTIASLQPTAEEFINRFFELPGPEKLLVLDVLDFPHSSWPAREQRLAQAGVPVARSRHAIVNAVDTKLVREDGEHMVLSPTTRDAFRTLRILRD
ncbi:MAG: hypothetical protein M5U25_20935 [Planctomycetota bacterium]|nr:hypothetical protein [Planctomycetota bacterium]